MGELIQLRRPLFIPKGWNILLDCPCSLTCRMLEVQGVHVGLKNVVVGC